EWLRWALPRSCIVLPWTFSYLLPVQGNIRAALNALDAQPYESVYVCFDPDDLDEAISTRLGTLLVHRDPSPAYLPDLNADDLEDAIETLSYYRQGIPAGYVAEVAS